LKYMNDTLIPSTNNTPPRSFGKILNIIIAVIVVLLLVVGLVFGVLALRKKLTGGALSQTASEQKRKEELVALNKALDNIRITDEDLDGLTADQEKQSGTDPKKSDTDGDGILDKTEIEVWKTDPLNADTDGDGYKDGYEVKRNYNPLKKGN